MILQRLLRLLQSDKDWVKAYSSFKRRLHIQSIISRNLNIVYKDFNFIALFRFLRFLGFVRRLIVCVSEIED